MLTQKSITVHGVFMEVFDIGLLLEGVSGIGKSELALELITRGHRLVADDAPIFNLDKNQAVIGSCPDVLLNFIELRGIGIINIAAMFGENAIKQSKPLQLIVKLIEMNDKQVQAIDRISGVRTTREIFNNSIPEITLPVSTARNLAVLVEICARDHKLRLSGYDASEIFCQHQQDMINKASS